MQVLLYYNESDNIRIGKSLKNHIAIENVMLKQPTDLVNPTLILSNSKIMDSNYLYIPQLKRYYFINNITLTNSHTYEIKCHVDVLETYKEDLKNISAFILRQENIYNVNFNDSLLPIRSDTNYKSIPFGDVPSDYKFYITTNGGVI